MVSIVRVFLRLRYWVAGVFVGCGCVVLRVRLYLVTVCCGCVGGYLLRCYECSPGPCVWAGELLGFGYGVMFLASCR